MDYCPGGSLAQQAQLEKAYAQYRSGDQAQALATLDSEGQRRMGALVPSARAYPLPKLLAALDAYQAVTQQRVFIEYVMLSGINDAPEHAAELGELLRGRDVVVNLIPWNEVYSTEAMAYRAPGPERLAAFHGALRGCGLAVTVRQEKGQDISGACGQLVVESAMLSGGGGGGGGGCGGGGECGGGGSSDVAKLAGAGGGVVADIEELAAA